MGAFRQPDVLAMSVDFALPGESGRHILRHGDAGKPQIARNTMVEIHGREAVVPIIAFAGREICRLRPRVAGIADVGKGNIFKFAL